MSCLILVSQSLLINLLLNTQFIYDKYLHILRNESKNCKIMNAPLQSYFSAALLKIKYQLFQF